MDTKHYCEEIKQLIDKLRKEKTNLLSFLEKPMPRLGKLDASTSGKYVHETRIQIDTICKNAKQHIDSGRAASSSVVQKAVQMVTDGIAQHVDYLASQAIHYKSVHVIWNNNRLLKYIQQYGLDQQDDFWTRLEQNVKQINETKYK